MRALLLLAFAVATAACTTIEPQRQIAATGNGGCYLGNGVYSGARCPGQHP
jgi:hypothetical protein